MLLNHDVITLKALSIFNSQKITFLADRTGAPRGINFKLDEEGKFFQGKELHKMKNKHYPQVDINNATILELMKERILRIAIICNGGWYLLAGDEYGVLHRPEVFDDDKEPNRVIGKWGELDDLREYICYLNTMLSFLPKPHLGDRSIQRRIRIDDRLLHISIRHSASTNKDYVICMCSKGVLEEEMILSCLRQNGYISNNNEVYLLVTNRLYYVNQSRETMSLDRKPKINDLSLTSRLSLQEVLKLYALAEARFIAKNPNFACDSLEQAVSIFNNLII